MKTPKCPKCGHDKFREYQICTEKVFLWFDDTGEEHYSDSEFISVDSVDEITCENCDENVMQVILDFRNHQAKQRKVQEAMNTWRTTWPILKKEDVQAINSLLAFHGHVDVGMDWLAGWSQGPAWEHAIAALVAVRLGLILDANNEIIEAQRHENGELGSD
jgi:hypothetical protein